MTEMVEAKINDRWPLTLPDFRETFHRERPQWEAGRLEHCAEHMKPGDIVYDIGAELGDFSSLYRSFVGDEGAVVLIEPKREMWPTIMNTWIANFPGTRPAAMFVGFASDITQPVPGQNMVVVRENAWPKEVNGLMVNDPGFHHLAQESQVFQQTRIDSLAWSLGRELWPDVVTLDIEGAELRALRGLGCLIEAGHRPLVYVSVHQVECQPQALADWYGATRLDIHFLMEQLYGYKPGVELPRYGAGEEFWVWEAL